MRYSDLTSCIGKLMHSPQLLNCTIPANVRLNSNELFLLHIPLGILSDNGHNHPNVQSILLVGTRNHCNIHKWGTVWDISIRGFLFACAGMCCYNSCISIVENYTLSDVQWDPDDYQANVVHQSMYILPHYGYILLPFASIYWQVACQVQYQDTPVCTEDNYYSWKHEFQRNLGKIDDHSSQPSEGSSAHTDKWNIPSATPLEQHQQIHRNSHQISGQPLLHCSHRSKLFYLATSTIKYNVP